jgi:hypothetical protein
MILAKSLGEGLDNSATMQHMYVAKQSDWP